MVGIKRKRSTFHQMLEVTYGFMCSVELSIIGRPFLLRSGQLLTEECQWFPSAGTSLLQNSTHCYLGGVGGQGQWQLRIRVMQHGGVGEGRFDGLERLCHILGPVQFLWLVAEALEQVEQMVSCMPYEPTIVVHHPEKTLEFFDGGGRLHLSDGIDI